MAYSETNDKMVGGTACKDRRSTQQRQKVYTAKTEGLHSKDNCTLISIHSACMLYMMALWKLYQILFQILFQQILHKVTWMSLTAGEVFSNDTALVDRLTAGLWWTHLLEVGPDY